MATKPHPDTKTLAEPEDAAGDAPLLTSMFFPSHNNNKRACWKSNNNNYGGHRLNSIANYCLFNLGAPVIVLIIPLHFFPPGQQGIRDGAHQSQSLRTGQCGGPVQNQETYPAAETDERLLRPSCEYLFQDQFLFVTSTL